MPLAHGCAVGGHDILEQFSAARLTQLADDASQPILVFRLDTQAAFPARMQQVVPNFRQIFFFHQIGVVGLDKHIQTGADPFTMRAHCRGHEIGMMRRLDRLEDLFAVHGFEFGAIGLDDVDGVPVGARLGYRALQHLLGTGTPHAGLDAVLLLEASHQRAHVVTLSRGVDAQDTFLLGAFDQALHAVGTFVLGKIGHGAASRGLCHNQHGQRGAGEQQCRQAGELTFFHRCFLTVWTASRCE